MAKNKKYFRKRIFDAMVLLSLLCGCTAQERDKRQDTETEAPEASRHAFLLGDDTFYCLDFPVGWVADLSDARHLALYWPDAQEGSVCGLSVEKAEYDSGQEAQALEEYDSIFYFANGMAGVRQLYEQNGSVSDYGKDEKQYQLEKIFSDNKNECINVRMEKEKYERNCDEMEQVIHTSYFQRDTVGIPCEEPLEKRERVCVHVNNGMFALKILVPQGVSFYEGSYDWFGDYGNPEDIQLIFYLDDEKKQYVQIFSNSQGYLWEDERLVWQQVQYDVSQITKTGQLVRHFQFQGESTEYFWFSFEEIAVCVYVKEDAVRKVADEMVASIRGD